MTCFYSALHKRILFGSRDSKSHDNYCIANRLLKPNDQQYFLSPLARDEQNLETQFNWSAMNYDSPKSNVHHCQILNWFCNCCRFFRDFTPWIWRNLGILLCFGEFLGTEQARKILIFLFRKGNMQPKSSFHSKFSCFQLLNAEFLDSIPSKCR